MTRGQAIDVIQTAAIVVVCVVLMYAIWRLERQVRAWAGMLAEINAKMAEQVGRPNDYAGLADALGRAWERILKLEARLDATEQGLPPPPGTRPTDPAYGQPQTPPDRS